jgi:hypothetical protein
MKNQAYRLIQKQQEIKNNYRNKFNHENSWNNNSISFGWFFC